jgi:hypothetical protein
MPKNGFREAELFLSLPLDIASRMLSIVCSLFLVQGQIFCWKVGVQANQPNHRVKPGKRLCIRRLRRSYPSLRRWLFHVCQVSVGLQRVPRLCDRYVHLQLVVLFENQGLLAKNHHIIYFRKPLILVFLPEASRKAFWVSQHN